MLIRTLAVLTAVSAALLLAVSALADATPTQVVVWQYGTGLGHQADIDVDVYVAPDTASTAAAEVYVPAGYELPLSQPIGATLGKVDATMLTGASSVAGKGPILVADPSAYATQTCDTGAHAAVWLAQLTVGGQAADVPIYVDPASSDILQTAYTLRACFANPAGLGGLRLKELQLELKNIRNPSAANAYLWHALVTPFGSDGTPAAGSTIELQSLVPIPQTIALSTKYDAKRHVVVLSGAVNAAGRPRRGVHVRVVSSPDSGFASTKSFGVATTDKSGHFSLTHALTKTTYFDVYINQYYYDNCDQVVSSAPCTSETLSPPPDAWAKVSVRR